MLTRLPIPIFIGAPLSLTPSHLYAVGVTSINPKTLSVNPLGLLITDRHTRRLVPNMQHSPSCLELYVDTVMYCLGNSRIYLALRFYGA